MKTKLLIQLVLITLTLPIFSQSKIEYKNITLKIPLNWKYKCQEIKENQVFQISCWNTSNEKSFVLQWIKEKIDNEEYLRILKKSLLKQYLLNETNFTNNYQVFINEIPSLTTRYRDTLSDYKYEGQIQAFQFGEYSYIILQQCELGASFIDFEEIKKSISFNFSKIDKYTNWHTYRIKDIGAISIPSKLELRDENSQIALISEILNDKLIKTFEINQSNEKIVFQPKGLNENPEENKLYARVIINYYKGNSGDFLKKDDGFNTNISEIEELNAYFKNYTENELKKVNNKLMHWDRFSFQNINGFASLRVSFVRQGTSNSPIQVIEYKIPNDSNMVVITLSYKLSEKDIWSEDFNQIVNTFHPE